jgi:methylenetetrahydrofolate reductase (NADPH)
MAASKDKMVCELINEAKQTWYSFEYFPPRTDDGVTNLKKRMERMKKLNPLFMDYTWGAGGSTSDLTIELCGYCKNETGVTANMHLTCTNMEKSKVDIALAESKASGVCNLVALRGDPPRGEDKWAAVEGGFNCALDLVKYIRKETGDYFSISVAGYPEGHPDAMEDIPGGMAALTESEKRRASVTIKDGKEVVNVCRDASFDKEMKYMKEKCDAGAQFIITQMFLDAQVYVDFVKTCREYGINVPVIPGIMCLNGLGGLKRMTDMCKTRVPEGVMKAAEDAGAVSDDAFKAWGVKYMADVCRQCLAGGAPGLHFYTLNLENATLGMLQNLNLITAEQAAACSAGDADATSMVSAQGITTDEQRPKLSGNRSLKEADPVMAGLIEEEKSRQMRCIELIASENFTSKAV